MKPNTIDKYKCTGCGLCVEQCSHEILKPESNGKIRIQDGYCIECGHCIAVCPTGALGVNGKIPESVAVCPASAEMLSILRSRRSMRKFLSKDVEDEKLRELADYVRFAPTGTNSEATQVVFVKSPEKIQKLTDKLMKFYIRLNRITSFFLVRWLVLLFFPKEKALEMKKSLVRMIKRYKEKKDPLFHHSPVVVFMVFYGRNASTPKDDACYALYNLVLGAESMGLATCINELSVVAYKRMKRKIRRILGLPKQAKIYSCTSLGYPAYSYKRMVFRKPANYLVIS